METETVEVEDSLSFDISSQSKLVIRDVSVNMDGQGIIRNVSCLAQSGKLLAIMGPSGAGKTTLLNVIAGRAPVASGEVTLNGSAVTRKMKRKISYVLQQDIFFPNLTVKDTLTFAAALKLPDKLSYLEKMKKRDEIIESLDLKKCLNTMIGGDMMPGISGGERKRVNIACELLTDPALVLLDEPTTGLDSSMSLSLIQTMKMYAITHNKIIMATIHQPSTRLFNTFDHLLLLCQGQVAYYGPMGAIVDYFNRIDVPITPGFNPADFILEKMKGDKDTQAHIIQAAIENRNTDNWPSVLKEEALFEDWDEAESPTMLVTPDVEEERVFFGKFQRRKHISDKGENNSVHSSVKDIDHISFNEILKRKWPTGFSTQYKHLTMRNFQLYKSRIFNVIKVLENVLICAMVSLIWFQLPRSEETIRDRMGVIFFISIHWAYTPLFDAVSSFPMERMVINKERIAGWYCLSAYYLSKMTSELPLVILQPLLFVTVVYWTVGLSGVTAFFATVGTLLINSMAGQSLGLFLGITISDMRPAIKVAILIEMAMMLLAGLFTRTLPVWLDWMKYLSLVYYSFHCLLYIEFDGGPPLQCPSERNSSLFSVCKDNNATRSIPSNLILEYYDVKWEYWQYFLPLIAYILVFRLLGYIFLKYERKSLCC